MYFKTQLLLTLLFYFFSAISSFSQDYIAHIQHFGVEEGLSHREVYCIYKDQRGLIWIGTKYGLNRFDGREFKLYTKEKNGLASNEIHYILEDAEGYLWLITSAHPFEKSIKHLTLLDPITGESLYSEHKQSLLVQLEQTKGFLGRENGTIYLGLSNGNIFQYRSGKDYKIIKTRKSNLNIQPIDLTKEGNILGIVEEKDTLSWLEVDTFGQIQNQVILSQKGGKFYYLGTDPMQQYWFYLNFETVISPVYTISGKNKIQLQDFSSLNIPVKAFKAGLSWPFSYAHRAYDHNFWFVSDEHFYIFHPKEGLQYNLGEAHPSLINLTKNIFFDDEQIAWISSPNGAVAVQLEPNSFERILYKDLSGQSFANVLSCRGVTKDEQGRLFINTYKGRFLAKKGQVEKIDQIHSSFLLVGHALLEDKNGNLWFGGSNALIRRNNITEQEDLFILPGDYINNARAVWSLHEDRLGKIWFGAERMIGFYEPNKNRVELFDQYHHFEALKEGIIYDFHEIGDGNFWLSSSTGLYLMDEDKGITARYWSGGEGQFFLPANDFHHLYKDEQGVLWLATGDGGLIRWTYQDALPTFEQFTIADGLSSNNLHATYEDEFGFLWIPSEYGIIQFHKQSHQSKAYLPSDGTSHHEFNRISHFQDKEGRLYFGTVNGVTAFHPRDFYQTDIGALPNVSLLITDFEQYSGKKDTLENRLDKLLDKQEIILRPGDRFFNLKFTLADYLNNRQVSYSYFIEGHENTWNDIKENNIRISGLPYGQYQLKVKGRLPNGQFSSQELRIPVQVIRPFYLQIWFLLLCGFLFLLSGIALYKWRTRQLKRKADELKAQVEERTETISHQNKQLQHQAKELRQLDEVKSRFFANISHELRTPLTLLIGPIKSVLQRKRLESHDFKLLTTAKENGQQLLGMINQILDLTKLESGKLAVIEEPVEFYSFTRRIFSFFESHADIEGIKLQFRYQPDRYLKIMLDKKKFETLLKNLLSNALKFTPNGGTVTLHIKEKPNLIRLHVQDTGRGIHPADLPHIFDRYYQTSQLNTPVEGGSGVGLAICKEFSELLNGQLWAESELGKGTCFYFEFPKTEVLGTSVLISPSNTPLSASNPQKERAISNNASKGATVLIVEDNHSLRAYLSLTLENDYQVVTANNGKQALTLLEKGELQQDPNLIISDVMMPEMDGFQFLQALKSVEAWRSIPVIMLTARAAIQDKLHALRIGVDDYMMKPFEEEELLLRIQNLLNNQQARQEWKEKQLDSTESPNPNPKTKISQEDTLWLENLEKTVQEKLGHFDLTAEQIAYDLALSRRQFFRRVKLLTGLTPNEYIREVRYHTARLLLDNRSKNSVKAVAYSIGVRDIKYFSQQFKKRFGKYPSSYF